eukprot:TRINITY_DN313_c4_g1_i1.p1 TRINITY_DN313_c4_g1~~TRINITY_DN313_c4_g1_i1.p1  ORF type:complete len:125 (+),score=9.52 TRINITY_DN313_c4_g1_i1:1324-1698(+)
MLHTAPCNTDPKASMISPPSKTQAILHGPTPFQVAPSLRSSSRFTKTCRCFGRGFIRYSLDLLLIVARNSYVLRVFQSKLIVERDPANSMTCFPHGAGDSTFFLKIKELSSHGSSVLSSTKAGQ